MKSLVISIIALGIIVGGVFLVGKNIGNNQDIKAGNENGFVDTATVDVNNSNSTTTDIKNSTSTDLVESTSNVSIVDGVQIIEIKVKKGYQPQESVAKAGIPTIIRFVTDNTMDCSSSIKIESLNISKKLPKTGTTDIDLGTPINGTLKGSCSMEMFLFQIDFK